MKLNYGIVMVWIQKVHQIMWATFILFSFSMAQMLDDEFDKCGFDSSLAKANLKILGDHWGYSYDSLLIDLDKWASSPYITIDSLGASVQNRAIWQLTITANDITKSTANDITKSTKHSVFFHARTHPGEVQSWWVAEQVINILNSDTEFARMLRDRCVFYIVPMYNPDGVELEYPRENAHGVDIESNWNKNPTEPEVAVLKKRFSELMASDAPIEVAMNMHSAYGTDRFFVFHDSVGTSSRYTILEQDYIGGVRENFISGIKPWDYRITWTTGTPTYYPESWFWLNFQEDVMALTYEDMNSILATDFDSTANALLHGIADYLDIGTAIAEQNPGDIKPFRLFQNYPNPFNPDTRIKYQVSKLKNVKLVVYNALGQKVRTLVDQKQATGDYSVTLDGSDLSSGIYFYKLSTGSNVQVRKMVLMR